MKNTDIFLIEEKFRKIQKSIKNDIYSSKELIDLIFFFEELFESDDSLIIEAYLAESFNTLISLLEQYSPYGKPFNLTKRVLEILQKIEPFINSKKWQEEYITILKNVQKEQIELEKFLDGRIEEEYYSTKIAFPLVENRKQENDFGTFDTFTILLSPIKKSSHDEFLIIPSFPQLDNKIKEQLLNSWNYAKKQLSTTKVSKIPKFKVVIEYNKRLGFYTGNSNGVALTLGFIIELAKYLNLSKMYEINQNILFTGLVNEKGVIEEVSEEIIAKKIKIAFYSKYNSMVLPQNDFSHAKLVLEEEKKKFPDRKFNLIPVNNVDEIISNPSISRVTRINFWKQNLLKAKKNQSILLFIFLFVISSIMIFSLKSSNSENIYPIETEDFLEYAKMEFGLDEGKLSHLNDMGEILNLKFEPNDLDTSENSLISDYNNIELVNNRFNESERAFRFNGFDSELTLTKKYQLKIPLPISVSMWFRKLDNAPGWLFTNNFDNNSLYGVHLGFLQGNIITWRYGNGGKIGKAPSRGGINSINPIESNKWNHIVCILDDYGSYRIYLNGRKINIFYIGTEDEIKYNNGEIIFGKFKSSTVIPPPYYKGDMDDFRIFNRVLTEAEVELLFHEK